MEEDISLENKKKIGIIPKIIIFILIISIFIYCYMRFLEPTFLIVKEEAVISELIPESFNGFKIVQFSDIHFGRTTNEQELEKVINHILELKTDILVFTGDLFDDYITLSNNNKQFLKDTLKKTSARLGKYAILGDEDYLDISLYEEIMKEAGFKILDNENIPIYYEGNTPIYLSGIPSISKKEQDLSKAFLKENGGYQILLMHEPILFDDVKNDANLVLAGHSLGGLVRLPYLDGLFHLENTGNYQTGKYTLGNSTMYVSSGIGTQNISLRFFNPPSITLYRLYNN